MVKKNLCGMTSEEIFHLIRPTGFTISHAVVIANSIYRKRIAEIPLINKIPAKLRIELADNACSGIFKPAAFEVSADRTVKYLFRTETGKEFETVYIPDNKRVTVCVSTQSGCRMGCPFCITARYGFRGNLSAGEIINQIISIPDAEKITHVVFMGMGEPLDNLENVLKACEIITAGWGMAISPRNVTVSTVGITSGVEKFLGNSDCNLTLSLYSPFPEERKKVVPAEKHYPALRIIEMMKNYPVRKKRRLSLAYIMIKGLNDSEKHLDSLITLLKGSAIRVNLIPYNPSGHDLYTSSSADRMQNFRHRLVISGVSASVRKSRGTDISAACGQLAAGLIS
jgi:23S rRNA (adenine2503-C2)-methyltransferase